MYKTISITIRQDNAKKVNKLAESRGISTSRVFQLLACYAHGIGFEGVTGVSCAATRRYGEGTVCMRYYVSKKIPDYTPEVDELAKKLDVSRSAVFDILIDCYFDLMCDKYFGYDGRE